MANGSGASSALQGRVRHGARGVCREPYADASRRVVNHLRMRRVVNGRAAPRAVTLPAFVEPSLLGWG